MPEPNNDFHRVGQGEDGRGAARRPGQQLPAAPTALLLGRRSPSPARGCRAGAAAARRGPGGGKSVSAPRAAPGGKRGLRAAPRGSAGARGSRLPRGCAARAPAGTFRREPRPRPAAERPGRQPHLGGACGGGPAAASDSHLCKRPGTGPATPLEGPVLQHGSWRSLVVTYLALKKKKKGSTETYDKHTVA